MNKPNKVTLPTIGLTSEGQEHRTKKKFFKGWIMNDTFSNWRKKSTKDSSPSNSPQLLIQSSAKGHGTSKSQLRSGMTLGDYFRNRSNTEHSYAQQTYDVPEEQILPYMRENFQIHQTDEDNYDDSQTSIHISNNRKVRAKQQLQVENSQLIKVKTQCDEQSHPYVAPSSLKKKGFGNNRSKDRMQQIQQMQQSFDLKSKNRNRALSNETSKKFKVSQSSRKNTILERVKADKQRASELKSINVDLVMKYANKFHLNEKSCLQIIKAGP